ncbi:ABC transporter substrate-binding protein [Pseudomonas sp. p106]|uniref:ABC transporter substrate-binding protein n=1 Tax=Pseudomonas sp. p106 TaxID=2479854 RepID=UPI000F7AF57B|nr:ABC transporter substrate-binding protein [Pseudomonas sp. p106]RRV42655.1 ABC transporter substrate-binding protein [Pseudomonas sp. p106]
MTQIFNPHRRRFLRNSALLGLGFAVSGIAAPYIARAAAQIRIAVNPGLENATLTALLNQQGYLRQFGVDALVVEAGGATGPFDAIAAGAADVCMISGYNGLLSRIEQGAPVKVVGAGMKKTALTVFARAEGIKGIADLKGKTVAVGPSMGLLHVLMLQLLKVKGIDASQVNFVDKGSNDQCYRAVANGEVDACCSSISHLNDKDGLVVIPEGNLWQELPKYTFQTAYASDAALTGRYEGLVGVMAAYGALYDYLMSPAAHDAFFDARRRAEKRLDEASAQAVWDFIQTQRPYSKDLSLSDEDIGYQQDIYIGLGGLSRKLPFAAVANMSAARTAAKLIG